MTDLTELIARVEACEGGSDELSRLIVCATVAPAGAYVEQSKFNGAWCIYDGTLTRTNAPRLWEPYDRDQGLTRLEVSTSLDAALALVERVLEAEPLDLLGEALEDLQTSGWRNDEPRAPQLARKVCAHLLKALQTREAQP